MIAAVADTHADLWHLAADLRLSAGARAFIEAAAERGDRIGISAITFAEVVYLVEKKRIPEGWSERLFAVVQNARNVFLEDDARRLFGDLGIGDAAAVAAVAASPD